MAGEEGRRGSKENGRGGAGKNNPVPLTGPSLTSWGHKGSGKNWEGGVVRQDFGEWAQKEGYREDKIREGWATPPLYLFLAGSNVYNWECQEEEGERGEGEPKEAA